MTSRSPALAIRVRSSSASGRENGARIVVAASGPMCRSSISARRAKPGLCWIARQTLTANLPSETRTRRISPEGGRPVGEKLQSLLAHDEVEGGIRKGHGDGAAFQPCARHAGDWRE